MKKKLSPKASFIFTYAPALILGILLIPIGMATRNQDAFNTCLGIAILLWIMGLPFSVWNYYAKKRNPQKVGI